MRVWNYHSLIWWLISDKTVTDVILLRDIIINYNNKNSGILAILFPFSKNLSWPPPCLLCVCVRVRMASQSVDLNFYQRSKGPLSTCWPMLSYISCIHTPPLLPCTHTIQYTVCGFGCFSFYLAIVNINTGLLHFVLSINYLPLLWCLESQHRNMVSTDWVDTF